MNLVKDKFNRENYFVQEIKISHKGAKRSLSGCEKDEIQMEIHISVKTSSPIGCWYVQTGLIAWRLLYSGAIEQPI